MCVRHNDDCNAVCVPREHDPTKKRVCTKATLTQTTLPSPVAWKGCNRIVKVPKVNAAKDETDPAKLFDIVVCQVRSRVLLVVASFDSPF